MIITVHSQRQQTGLTTFEMATKSHTDSIAVVNSITCPNVPVLDMRDGSPRLMLRTDDARARSHPLWRIETDRDGSQWLTRVMEERA